MKYVSIDQVMQGEYLAKPIYASDGRILLEHGVLLTIGLISRLRQLGITALYIKSEKDFNHAVEVAEEEIITEETKREAVATLAECYQYIQSGKKDFKLKAVSKVAGSIIEEVMNNQDVLVGLTDIRTKDNHLFLHSVNVCVMSILVGLKMNMDRSKLRDLAVGALLHDIGKVIADVENPTVENENDHTWKGFNVLRRNPELSKLSTIISLQHHECIDGSGYPQGIQAPDIHMNSKIVAVANAYDNYISGENKLGVLYPFEACERIMGLTNRQFDHDVVWNFLRSVAFYPNGSHVKLTTGETGIVVGQNSGLPQRPIIHLIETSFQLEDVEVKELDLSRNPTIFIKEIIA